jgi:uncharacterized membrane protein YidH (DUF202 family)
MEQNQQSSGTSLFQLNLDATNSYTLRSAASWGKVLGVVGLIIGLLCFVMGIAVQQQVSNIEGLSTYKSRGFSTSTMGNMGLVVYVIMGLLYIISSMFALNAGNKINRALKTNDQASLNSGFAGIRNYFAFWAILMIIMLLFMLIGVAGLLSGAGS